MGLDGDFGCSWCWGAWGSCSWGHLAEDFGEGGDGFSLWSAQLGVRGGRCWVKKGIGEVLCRKGGCISRGHTEHGNNLREKFDSVAVAFCSGFGDVNLVAPVVLQGGSKIPADFSVGCPGCAVFGFVMRHNLRPWRCHGCGVVIKFTGDVAVGG